VIEEALTGWIHTAGDPLPHLTDRSPDHSPRRVKCGGGVHVKSLEGKVREREVKVGASFSIHTCPAVLPSAVGSFDADTAIVAIAGWYSV